MIACLCLNTNMARLNLRTLVFLLMAMVKMHSKYEAIQKKLMAGFFLIIIRLAAHW